MTPGPDIYILLAIIAFTIMAFVREWLPIDVVALTCLGLLLLFNLVSPEEAVSGFSNSAVITVLMMFILSAALVQSGLVTKTGYRIADFAGNSQWLAAILLLLLTGLLSAFISNTAVVSVFMPVAIHLSRHYKSSPSKLLMPLSYCAIIGGSCTLFGTSTNLLVGSLAEQHGDAPFSVFEFLYLGAPMLAIGLLYSILIPIRKLPGRSPATLTGKYKLSDYLTELRIAKGSRLLGRTVLEEQISERFTLNVIGILRGKTRIISDLRNTHLRDGDILLVRGRMDDILAFKEQSGLLLLTDVKLTDSDLSDENTILSEVQLSPTSEFVGSTLRQIDFRRRFGCFVLAISSTGQFIQEKVALIPLRQWDTLLIFGPRSRVEALYKLPDFIPLGEHDTRLRLAQRWWISAASIPIVVLLATTGMMSILKAVILAVVVLLLTRCITIRQAYRGIDWSVIFLLAAILPLGIAMENTGLADLIGHAMAGAGTRFGPMIMLSLLYLVTSLLTSIFSNNATAVLMVPISFTISATLGLDPKPFLMAVAYAASASFMTPMGYQTNAMVFGPGQYRVGDFIRFGSPLNLIYWILATLLIPVIWPFQP